LHLEEIGAKPADGRANAGRKYYFNLFHCNADTALTVVSHSGRPTDAYFDISHWVWETETFPRKWSLSFQLFDEIWTPSRFCVEAISKRSPIPVLRVPYCIDPATRDGLSVDRSRFGLADGDFLFFCGFDTLSVPQRKNPFGVIEAFRRAFPAPGNCRLVLKVNNAHLAGELMQQLRAAAEGAAVSFIEGTLTRQETSELIAACDCLVSLHRCEGFGLMLAEAMLMRKPVICTNYSGNTDFSTAASAFLVDYSLTPVGPGCAPYDEDVLWAEPSIDDAARQMRIVRENTILREQVAEAGQ
jgi:glycosyltransferase involved in cell wall biosynthesis